MATKTLFVDSNSGETLEVTASERGIILNISGTSFLIEDADLPEFKAELKAREKQMEAMQENAETEGK